MNTKQQGSLGVAHAINHFTSEGYAVFVPVTDTMRYDLIVDKGSGPIRVEVKTTSTGKVMLRTCGGNQSWNGVYKTISKEDCDLVYCYNCTSGSYRIYTSSDLDGRRQVTLW